MHKPEIILNIRKSQQNETQHNRVSKRESADLDSEKIVETTAQGYLLNSLEKAIVQGYLCLTNSRPPEHTAVTLRALEISQRKNSEAEISS